MYNIALVEDERDLNDLIKAYLEKEGYKVTSYYDGESIINDIKTNYHLYILDIMLGGDVSGYDIIKKIREDNRNKDYDDWTGITYVKGSDVTVSGFLKKTWGFSKVTGACMDGNPDKKACAEVSLRDE